VRLLRDRHRDAGAGAAEKIDHILAKLRVEPGQRLLDIGCGWGALVLRAAQKFGARCVGITLSQNQFDLACERVRAAGLADRVEIRLQDYRDVTETFDRITSVGMCEHVGLKNLEPYFQIIHDRLAPGGWALNHGITSTDADNAETSHGGGRFIDRYVFPQGELPHVSLVLSTLQRGGLEPVDAESLRRHYARTLQCWSDNFEAGGEHLKSLVDEKKWRIWRMYLVGCQWAFEHDEISLFQVLCRRAGKAPPPCPGRAGSCTAAPERGARLRGTASAVRLVHAARAVAQHQHGVVAVAPPAVDRAVHAGRAHRHARHRQAQRVGALAAGAAPRPRPWPSIVAAHQRRVAEPYFVASPNRARARRCCRRRARSRQSRFAPCARSSRGSSRSWRPSRPRPPWPWGALRPQGAAGHGGHAGGGPARMAAR
jgi:cyclopropane fatty-acyl-phospholipid synthase-like methyltransferase